MAPKSRLRDQWLWSRTFVQVFLLTPVAVTLVVVACLYPVLGRLALLFLLLVLLGPLLGVIWGVMGSKVRTLKESFADEEGEVAESLIVNGRLQSPGVAVLTPTELILAPVVGETRRIKLDEIRSVRLTRLFNGKTMPWKRWLVLSTSPPLGFALPEATACRWSAKLQEQSP